MVISLGLNLKINMQRPNQQRINVVNVCLNDFIKSVSCDRPCSEGHDVRNLVSSCIMDRNKGFLVEGFIKPPVLLTFEFNCKIDIRYIVLLCNVGAQKSSGIELFVQSYSSDRQYESVCSGILKGNERGFVFHRYSENVKSKFGEQYCFRALKSSRCLSVVTSIKLKIFRTDGSSVPALGKVEIWGVSNKSLTNVPKNCMQNKKISEPNLINGVKNNKPRNERTSCSYLVSERVTIPDDFIDPITCEVMCQPVTLPSGKIIDISTLESYEKAESHWGRGPSDPFTGIPFTNTSKPVAASDLKARIDKFLCNNSNNRDFHNIPRTVGRSCTSSQKDFCKPSVSKLVLNEQNERIVSPSSSGIVKKKSSTTISGNETCVVKRRKVELSMNKGCRNESNFKEEMTHENNVKKLPVFSLPNSLASNSFQERMEQSLELSLQSTLSKLPSFTADKPETSKNSVVECHVCKLCDNLFSIPCNHFLCRNCLVNLRRKESLVCLLCNSSFQSCDVQKIHVS